MMTNLVTKILFQKRRFIIGWTIGMFALSLFMMLMFPALQKSDIGQLFEGMSPALQKIAGGADSFSTPDKYISGELFALRMPLLFIVLSIMLFSSLVIGDERRGILLTQLSLPFSRGKLLAQKLLVALIIFAVVGLGILLGISAGLVAIGETASLSQTLQHIVGCLLISLNFGLVVFALGGLGRKAAAVGIASGLAFVAYLVSSLTPIATGLEPFEKFSLFHYYQNPSPMSWSHTGLLLGLAVLEIAIGIVAFRRRDIG